MRGRKPRTTTEAKKGVHIETSGKACLTTLDITETNLRVAEWAVLVDIVGSETEVR